MSRTLLPVDFKTEPFNDCYARVCPETGKIVSITISSKPNREYSPPPGTGTQAAADPGAIDKVLSDWAWGRQMLKNPANGEVAHIPHWAVVKIVEEWTAKGAK